MKAILTFLLTVSSYIVIGQQIDMNSNTVSNKMFDSICSKTEHEFLGKDKGRGSGYKQFARWQEDNSHHLIDGQITNYTYLNQKAYQDYLEYNNSRTVENPGGTWQFLGLNDWTNTPDTDGGYNFGGWIPGNGRVSRLAADPFNSNIIYGGTASGGLWKYNTNTQIWTPLTDGMPNLSVSGIAIDHTVPGTMYILTGDGDGSVLSIGVLKSTDYGETWYQTALIWNDTVSVYPYRLVMHPDSNGVLYALTNMGIFKTSNGGITWPQVYNFTSYDIEFKPGDPSVIYISTSRNVLTSIDYGASWNIILDVNYLPAGNDANPSRRMEVAVTPGDSEVIYAVGGNGTRFKGIFKSSNGGASFDTLVSITPNILGQGKTPNDGDDTQVRYDLALAVHPTVTDMVYVGAINLWRHWPSGTGDDLQRKTFWNQTEIDPGDIYMHSDFHDLLYIGNMLYAAHDGGVCKAIIPTTGEPVWTDISAGLGISQLYHLAIYEQNSNNVLSGAQDNGTNKYSGTTTFAHIRGADGFGCHINYNNPNITYSSRQYGKIWQSADGDASFTEIRAHGDQTNIRFNFAFEMDPNDPLKLLVGKKNSVEYCLDGATFSNSVIVKAGWYVEAIAISKDVSGKVYVVSGLGNADTCLLFVNNNFYNGGSFVEIALPVEIGLRRITSVVVDPLNSQHIWISCSGYTQNAKVFYSENGGGNWTNLSATLPNVPVWTLAKGQGANNDIYAGTEIGVFYWDDNLGHWHYFNNGLPIVRVRDLQINTLQNEIYAGTYGRGLWKSSTYGDCSVALLLTPNDDPSNPLYTGVQRYEASSSIRSTRIVTGGYGTDVKYQAGDYVRLTPGFEAKTGNMFEAKTGACGTQVSSPLIVPVTGRLIMK